MAGSDWSNVAPLTACSLAGRAPTPSSSRSIGICSSSPPVLQAGARRSGVPVGTPVRQQRHLPTCIAQWRVLLHTVALSNAPAATPSTCAAQWRLLLHTAYTLTPLTGWHNHSGSQRTQDWQRASSASRSPPTVYAAVHSCALTRPASGAQPLGLALDTTAMVASGRVLDVDLGHAVG